MRCTFESSQLPQRFEFVHVSSDVICRSISINYFRPELEVKRETNWNSSRAHLFAHVDGERVHITLSSRRKKASTAEPRSSDESTPVP